MTIKKGDIVFVSQAHYSTPVPAVVLSVVPATSSGLPQANIHIISSADPYASILVAHREYADDAGYLESDESEPTENRPAPEPEGVGGTGTPEFTPEEDEDEPEESEGAEEVSEDESDGESVSSS